MTMAYNIAGQKTAQTYANGITTEYTYNMNGWLAEIKADRDIIHLQMEYDAIGNITKRIDALNAERTESYGYDVISQLTSFKRGTTVDKNYQFDLLGNRIKTLENGVATNYTSNNINAYTNIAGSLNITPKYDDNGNMLNDDKHTYKYDYNNKLVSVDGTDGTYKYDALGRRIAKNGTLYYYVGDQMVEEEAAGTTTSDLYGNNIDEALQMKRGNDTYYYHKNHLGSTMALSQKDGKLQERVEYDVYGAPSFFDAEGNNIEASSIANAILFTGREYDAETGTYYFRARTQHPAVGRFMQKDPLMYVDGMNDYAYVNNFSTLYVDPWGFSSLEIPDWRNSGRGSMNLNTGGQFGNPNGNSDTTNKSIWEMWKKKSNANTDTYNGKSYLDTNKKPNIKPSKLSRLLKNPKLTKRLLKNLLKTSGKQLLKKNLAGSATELVLLGGAMTYLAFTAEPAAASEMAKDYLYGEYVEPWTDLYDEWNNMPDEPEEPCRPDDPPCRYNASTNRFECEISK